MVSNPNVIDELSAPADWDQFLPPDWRRRDARRLARGKEARWSADDPSVLAFTEYLRACKAARNDREHAAVRSRWPAFAAVQEIARQAGPERWEIEARLLAGQSDEEIAERCGQPSEVIRAFEALFFDVRCRRHAWAWIAHQVIGDGLLYGFRDDDVDRLWRMFAYYGGVPALDAVVKPFRAVWRPGEPATAAVYFREECPASLTLKAVIASHCLPVNAETGMKITRLHARLVNMRKNIRGAKATAATEAIKRETIAMWLSWHGVPSDAAVQSRPVTETNSDAGVDQPKGKMPVTGGSQ